MPYKSIKRNVPTNAVSWKEISALPNSHWIRKLTLNERQISGVNSHSGCWWFGRQSDTSCAALALTIFWLRLGAVHEMDLYMTSNSLTRSYRMTEWGVFFPVPLFVNNKSGIFWTALSYIASYMLLLHSIHYIYIYTMPIYFLKKKRISPSNLKVHYLQVYNNDVETTKQMSKYQHEHTVPCATFESFPSLYLHFLIFQTRKFSSIIYVATPRAI